MSLQLKIYIALGLLLLGFGSGFGVRAYMAHAEKLAVENSSLKTEVGAAHDYVTKLEQRDKAIQELQGKLAANDTNATRTLNEQLAQNDALRTDLAAAQRMRFNGAICPKQPTAGTNSQAGTLGNGTGVELSADARQDVLNLRAAILRDQAKLNYLQGYAAAVSADKPPP